MLKTALKYLGWLIVVIVIAYNSVYVQKLSEVKAAEVKPFDAKSYARDYLFKKLPATYGKVPRLDVLLAELNSNPTEAFKKYANSQNGGDIGYFMAAGEGKIINIDESIVSLQTKAGPVSLATEYIFGNTVRDAPGLISIGEFSNSMDLNNVSEEINKLIKTEIVPPFKKKAQKGDSVSFVGCFELNKSALSLEKIEVIPVSLTLKN